MHARTHTGRLRTCRPSAQQTTCTLRAGTHTRDKNLFFHCAFGRLLGTRARSGAGAECTYCCIRTHPWAMLPCMQCFACERRQAPTCTDLRNSWCAPAARQTSAARRQQRTRRGTSGRQSGTRGAAVGGATSAGGGRPGGVVPERAVAVRKAGRSSGSPMVYWRHACGSRHTHTLSYTWTCKSCYMYGGPPRLARFQFVWPCSAQQVNVHPGVHACLH